MNLIIIQNATHVIQLDVWVVLLDIIPLLQDVYNVLLIVKFVLQMIVQLVMMDFMGQHVILAIKVVKIV